MEKCGQNLLILLLVGVFIFSVTRYIKHMKFNLNSQHNVTKNVIYPINNNTLQNTDLNEIEDDYLNSHKYTPDDNVVMVKNNQQNESTNFNYSKNLSNDFSEYDPDNKYQLVL